MIEVKKSAELNSYMDNRKLGKEAIFFAVVMFFAFYTILRGQNLAEIWNSIRGVSIPYLVLAGCMAVFFVSAEGFMIWHLLSAYGKSSSLPRCIQYSFIGFFYSGITPSATGGQPMQLYYMQKDGNSAADSSVVLMVVAAMYKFVLVIVGITIWAIWRKPLHIYFGNYYWLVILGIFLNALLVGLILAVILLPGWMMGVASFFLRIAQRVHLIKNAEMPLRKVEKFVDNYRQAVLFLKAHPAKLVTILVVTVLQRCSVFVLTWFLYCGFGLQGASLWVVTALQASIYVAVDMLPIPGAQGITELVFRKVFANIVGKSYLLPMMLVSRGVNFYFLFFISMIISMVEIAGRKRKGQ